MGAYGTPEHLPGENQEPQYQYGCSKDKKKGILHGDLKPWQKVLLIIYLCLAGFCELVMLVGLGTYSERKAFGIISAIAFFVLAVFFAVKTNAHKKAWPFVVCSLVAFFAYFAGMPVGQTSQAAAARLQASTAVASKQISTSSVGTNSKGKSAPSKAPASTMAQYKKQCLAYKYKTIARNPNTYQGKPAKFTGQATQIEEVWGSDTILLSVTKDEYGSWDDNVYIEYTPKSKSESRILEKDVITVYGKLNGIKTYTTVLGDSVSIPYLKAQYVDISPESK